MLLKGNVQASVKADFSDKTKPDQSTQECPLELAAKAAAAPKSKSGPPGKSRTPALKGKGTFATGLGKDVDALIGKSPTLKGAITTLQKNNWKFKYGTAGKGTTANRKTKTITIDSNHKGNAKEVVKYASHEVGHANYKLGKPSSDKGLTRQQYIDKNKMVNLRDEGAATLMNAKARNEIMDNGGGDIGIAGAQEKKYAELAKKHAKDLAKAREEIAKEYAKGEHPSNEPTKTYEQYYGEYWGQMYDYLQAKNAAAAKKAAGKVPGKKSK